MTEPALDRAVAGEAGTRRRCRLTITGTVQGVGFRPFLYRRALAHGLAGFAVNSPDGVVVEVEGGPAAVAAFIAEIREAPPTNARVQDVGVSEAAPCGGRAFAIRASHRDGGTATGVPPDLATCPACLAEIFDPGDRRYRYPFSNCTECGPRYSIIHELPYDRADTVMRDFPMCPACAAEYHDPASRRFHAEANTCPDCGPRLALWDGRGRELALRDDALVRAAAAVRGGRIVALKGLGGFHLLADARNGEAVARLRQRKRRPAKPLAVLFPDPDALACCCHVSKAEARLLGGRERPIVLLRRRTAAGIAPAVAPDNPYLGAMLPYTPLHHLLMAELGFPVVATSGNLSEEPIVTDEARAVARLGGIADVFLVHDRPILRPLDDSVTRVLRGRPQILRRARGYAPAPIDAGPLPAGILATGGHLKAAAALTRADGVILSQHIGDLDGPEARDAHAAVSADLQRLFRIRPCAVACDEHPDYYTTQHARHLAAAGDLPLLPVQHHLAHVAAAMGEHGLAPPVLGVAWDGSGYGRDGTVWGGECLLVTDDGWRRVAHLRAFRLPGGAAAVREPRRAALGLLYEVYGEATAAMENLPPVAAFEPAERRTLLAMLARGVNAPVTTSAGRLFDAVAALLGLNQVAAHEGQAACLLEWRRQEDGSGYGYGFPLRPASVPGVERVIDWEPALRAVLADTAAGVPAGTIAAAFHAGLAAAIAAVAEYTATERVVLTGGCFQNAALTELAADLLEDNGHRVYWHERVPPGDGGLALGQALWAARLLNKGEAPCA